MLVTIYEDTGYCHRKVSLMLNRIILLFVFACSISALSIQAESTDCTVPVIIIPDGRVTQSSFPQNTTYWYGLFAQGGHSYSVEFEPPADNYPNATRPQFNPLGVFGPTDYLQGCRGSSTVAVTQNSGYSPAMFKNGNGAGRRISFVAQTSGLHLIQVTNVMGTGGYTFRAIDTTLINVRWNTMSGNDVQWILMNVSDMPMTGTLSVIDMNGQVITAVQVSIPPGGRISRTTGSSDLNLPRELAGSAVFAHNGPPNSVIAEAFLLTGTGSLPEKFEGIR